MSYYSQWIKQPKSNQISWVLGSETVLIDEVVQFLKFSVKGVSTVLDLSEMSESAMFDRLFQHSLVDTEQKFVLVRTAEKITDFGKLKLWLGLSKTTFSNIRVCFVSYSDEIPEDYVFKTSKIMIVKCSKLNPEDLVKWTKRQAPISDRSVRAILDHTAGSLADTKSVCDKLSTILDASKINNVSSGMIAMLADETPSEFVDAVLSIDKPRAIKSIDHLSQDDRYRIVALLDTKLSQLVKLQGLLRSKKVGRELAHIPGLPYPVVQQLIPVCKFYSSSRISNCRQYLALVDAYHNQGVYSGTLESLVALW